MTLGWKAALFLSSFILVGYEDQHLPDPNRGHVLLSAKPSLPGTLWGFKDSNNVLNYEQVLQNLTCLFLSCSHYMVCVNSYLLCENDVVYIEIFVILIVCWLLLFLLFFSCPKLAAVPRWQHIVRAVRVAFNSRRNVVWNIKDNGENGHRWNHFPAMFIVILTRNLAERYWR